MKIENIKFTAVAYSIPMTAPSTIRMFCTEKALSNWANAQYRKDENVIIEVYKGFGCKELYCTYSA